MKRLREEAGVLIIEASIVFPIMFLVIFFLLFAGNVFLQVVKVEYIVQRAATEGAALCTSPVYSSVVDPSVDMQTAPYRYFSGMAHAEDQAADAVRDGISRMGDGLFSNMNPQNIEVNATYHNYFVYSYFDVEVSYMIRMPVALLFSDNMELEYTAYARVPTTDTTELIRNVDIVDDIYIGAGMGNSLEGFFGTLGDKIVGFLN